jgi:energy-coupling factor transport system ATP-binding protein
MAAYATRIVVMNAGNIVLNGPPSEILPQVEKLAGYHTRPPQVTELAYELERRGRPVAQYPVTLDQALQWIPS